jgi:hypothetical protein
MRYVQSESGFLAKNNLFECADLYKYLWLVFGIPGGISRLADNRVITATTPLAYEFRTAHYQNKPVQKID